ncbi:protein GLUTAMINE DUMPER 2-like [Momordica charantia]|uniref:Protein GLUTAMINE DUMPER 2-like n=1 Tax=Momordica charantia TaxID=3673 RepID=A0A6J1DLX1_MOMCH|nr:protein GLUTAMINE DUMPER 2-like [Momordica charantia]
MRPATSTTTPRNSTSAIEAGFGNWHSPIPYLFTGLALVLGLIAMALLVLSCSYLHSSSHSDPDAEPEQKPDNAAPRCHDEDSNPTIVVIMAGDDNPTFFAKHTTV